MKSEGPCLSNTFTSGRLPRLRADRTVLDAMIMKLEAHFTPTSRVCRTLTCPTTCADNAPGRLSDRGKCPQTPAPLRPSPPPVPRDYRECPQSRPTLAPCSCRFVGIDMDTGYIPRGGMVKQR
jgi:hypothetical protein